MFGYVQIRKPELKIKDYEVYHGFYCGLCSELKNQYGFWGQITLTYDMTFLVILLSSLYETDVIQKKERCIVHPTKKHLKLTSEISEYAAHLNMILAYYNLKDDSEDDHSKRAKLGMLIYQGKKKRAVQKYIQKDKAIQNSLEKLSAMEKSGEQDILKLAECFGYLMEELFAYKKDIFEEDLKQLGFHLGRFIYIMDAYDDMCEDEKKGSFNPLLKQADKPEFEKWIENILLDEIAAASAAFQKLPCLEYTDILGNILYAGVWNRFDDLRRKKEEGNQ